MATRHVNLTLDASQQSLSASLSPLAPMNVHFLSIQADAGNAGVVYVGSVAQTVSSSDYGFRIEIPVSSIPAAPSIVELGGGAAIDLTQIKVKGTNNDKIHLLIVD